MSAPREEALAQYRRACAHDRAGEMDLAVACARRAVALAGDDARFLRRLGNALLRAGEPAEAEAHLRRALALEPGHVDALADLGAALRDVGRLEEARVCFERVLAARPDDADTHIDLATSCLMAGDWTRGWAEYEWRRRIPAVGLPELPGPRWAGEPLGGRTLLVHTEQGLGDTLQMVRFLRHVPRERGAVVLACPPSMARLLGTCPGVDHVAPMAGRVPGYHCHAPLLSLPHLLGLTASCLPGAVPYLSPEPARVERWRPIVDGGRPGLTIGVCWQGNPNTPMGGRRSFPLAVLAPLARIEGVRLVSLQHGAGTDQLTEAVAAGWVRDLGLAQANAPDAFVDTAAVLPHLDLVVTLDTALAHLAGALGVETWLLLDAAPDWRWGVEGDRSPWYPATRIFRQARAGDWAGVVGAVCAAARERVGL